MASPIIEEGMRAHLQGRNRFLNMWTHDVAERMKIRRKGIAADAGLEPSYDVGTYPSEQTTVVQGGGPGMFKAALLTAALMGLGGAGVLGASHLLGSLPSSRAMPADVQPPAAVVPSTEFDITVETVDGKLKVTGVHEVE